MTDACKAIYTQLHRECGEVLQQSFTVPGAEEMARSHAFVSDLCRWISELSARSETQILRAATREYQFSLLALSCGQYRAAFSSLRLTLELCFAAVQWSANERELREWLRGHRDNTWAPLIDPDNGVLSKSFARLFTEPLADEAPTYRGTGLLPI